MPPRKEPKEAVVYPASKRKPPPFKPQRPSKVPRSTSATTAPTSQPVRRRNTAPTQPSRRKPSATATVDDSEADSPEPPSRTTRTAEKAVQEDDLLAFSSSLPRDPLEMPKRAASRPAPAQHGSPTRLSISSHSLPASPRPRDISPHEIVPLDDGAPTIPQNLLVRLLHEHFVDKSTKIDKNAVQVLQKYVEIFVREAIARAALQKRESAPIVDPGDNEVANMDLSWLELEDLEKIAAGMMLDF